jgi:tRNA pseudouridine32 synthase/23S rRNA pseudouridine746 synthase
VTDAGRTRPGFLPSGERYDPPKAPLRVIHQDRSVLAVAKPFGLLSVPGNEPWLDDCVESRAKAAFPRALTIHRLDMDTSGVMVFALTRPAQRHIHLQFERRQARKTYIARVWGTPSADRGQIDLPLSADWPNRPRQKVDLKDGKPAQTAWEVIDREGPATRLRLRPRTGRSHQLRVHLLSIGHPILGDRFYAPPGALAAASRLQLHAETLEIRHPETGDWLALHDPCPF